MSRRHTVDAQNSARQKQNQEILETLHSLSGFEFSDETFLDGPDLLAFALVLFHPAGQEIAGVSIPDDQLAFQIHDLVTGAFETLHRNPVLPSEQDASFWKKVAQRLSGDDGDFPHVKVPHPIELSNILSFYTDAIPKNPSDLDSDWVKDCSIIAVGAVAAWMCALGKLKSAAESVESWEPQQKRARPEPEATEELKDDKTAALKEVSKGLLGFWNRVTVMLHHANDKQMEEYSHDDAESENPSTSDSHRVSLTELDVLLQEESDECRHGARVLITIYNYLEQSSQVTRPAPGPRASHDTQANSPSRYPASVPELHREDGEHGSRRRSDTITIADAVEDSPVRIVSDIQPQPSAASISVQPQRTYEGFPHHEDAIPPPGVGLATKKRKHQETMQSLISRQSEMKDYPKLCEQLQEKINQYSQSTALLVSELEQVKSELCEAEVIIRQKGEAAQHKAQGEIVFLQQQLAYAVSGLRDVTTQQPGDGSELLQEKYTNCLSHVEAVILRFEQVVSSGDLVDPAGDIELYLWRFGMDLKRTKDVALAELVDRLHHMAAYMSYNVRSNDE